MKVPSIWFEPGSADNSPNTVSTVQVYKTPQSKEEILERHYDTKQQDDTLQEKHWTKTVQFNMEFSDHKSSFLEMMEKYEST